MRFLIDNALSPVLAEELRTQGHDAVHVRDIAMTAALDAEVILRARIEERILVSADTDFGLLMTMGAPTKPSVILFRRGADRRPLRQAELLHRNLPSIADQLEAGCIAIIEETRIRIRLLPIGLS